MRTNDGAGARAWWDAARFTGYLATHCQPRRVRMHRTSLAGTEAKVFEPVGRDARGTVVAVHGVAPSGFDDPRMVALARAMAASGLRAVVPRIESLERCELSERALEDISGAIVATARRADLSLDGQVSLFAACVSASLALVAAADRPARSVTRSVLALGPYAHVDRLLEHLLEGEEALEDDYGRTVLLYNWAEHVVGPLDEELRQALWLDLCDGHYGIAPGEPGRVERYLSERPHLRSTIASLKSAELCRSLAATLRVEKRALLDRMSPTLHLRGLRARSVELVHGATDAIVPCDESRALAEALAEDHGPATGLTITPLISHGDTRPVRPSLVMEAARLVGAFSRFFAAAGPSAGAPATAAEMPPLSAWSQALARARGVDS